MSRVVWASLGGSVVAVAGIVAVIALGGPSPEDPLARYARMQADPALLRAEQAELGLAPLAEQVAADLLAAVDAGRADEVAPLADPASPLGRMMERQAPEAWEALQVSLDAATARPTGSRRSSDPAVGPAGTRRIPPGR